MEIHSDITAMAQRFAQARNAQGLTPGQLASKSGIARQVINMVEKGYMVLTMQATDAIARALKVEATWLIGCDGCDAATAEARLVKMSEQRQEFFAMATEDLSAFAGSLIATDKARRSAAKKPPST